MAFFERIGATAQDARFGTATAGIPGISHGIHRFNRHTVHALNGGPDLDLVGTLVDTKSILLMLLRQTGHFFGYHRFFEGFHN